jgi:hypothetical protein
MMSNMVNMNSKLERTPIGGENEKRFKKPIKEEVDDFFEKFREKLKENIETGNNPSMISHELEVAVIGFITAAENHKGKEYTRDLVTELLSRWEGYKQPIMSNWQEENLVIKETRKYLSKYIPLSGAEKI